MKIKSKREGEVIIVQPRGQLDALTGPELNEYFKEKMKISNNLVTDLSNVDFVSSAGLRVFLGTVKVTRSAGGDLRLAGVTEDVRKILTVSGFDRILKIYPDAIKAVKSFSK